eukprot:TRINITY_DN4345_c0_g1_i16.p2 TRINITY_DN4345_c0_g1~~TRINITY_DN4345_c0_g1_i16.p2  ORF type:complete len:132 (-),score=24.12 TRINITY_DN4345_c0_g1_i16:1148-1543(-)
MREGVKRNITISKLVANRTKAQILGVVGSVNQLFFDPLPKTVNSSIYDEIGYQMKNVREAYSTLHNFVELEVVFHPQPPHPPFLNRRCGEALHHSIMSEYISHLLSDSMMMCGMKTGWKMLPCGVTSSQRS